MQRGEALDWAIVGTGDMEFDENGSEIIVTRLLTTLVNWTDGQSVEVIGSMIDYVKYQVGYD